MTRLILRIAVNAVALWAAAELVDGVTLSQQFWQVILVALIFGVVNAVIKPIATLFSLPFIVLTLGLFTLVVNTLMLMLTDALTSGLTVAGFGSAFWGALVISLVSWLLNMFVSDKKGKS